VEGRIENPLAIASPQGKQDLTPQHSVRCLEARDRLPDAPRDAIPVIIWQASAHNLPNSFNRKIAWIASQALGHSKYLELSRCPIRYIEFHATRTHDEETEGSRFTCKRRHFHTIEIAPIGRVEDRSAVFARPGSAFSVGATDGDDPREATAPRPCGGEH
jgi:hypothetical protein